MAWRCTTAATLIAFAACSQALGQQSLTPSDMPRITETDARFQSYNVEMVEVTGGRFWKPYGRTQARADQDIYADRPPIDLFDARLRKLAAVLSPAYLRVSGTWANATYFAGTRDPGGGWRPDQARRLLAYTRSLGADIAAAEFMNEPTLAAQNGAPAGYDAAAYGRDFGIFHALIRQTSPETLVRSAET